MIKRTLLVTLLLFLCSSTAQALTIDDIIYMSSAGVDESIIIAKIDASGYVYDLTTEQIVALWDAGVSPKVIEYMISTASQPGYRADDEVEGKLRYDDDYDDVGYYDDDYYDDDWYDDDYYVYRRRPTISLVFGFGYYDWWYDSYWWWHRPYYYDWGFYAGYYWPYYHWPSYYYWSPYAYGGHWGCWDRHWRCGHYDGYWKGGYRDQWRRGGALASAGYEGRSGHRLKPAYSVGGTKRGGYIARDGRYVFPKDKSRGGYLGVHRGTRKDVASRGYSSKGSSRGGETGKYYTSKRGRTTRDVKTTRGTYKRGKTYRTKDTRTGRSYKSGTRAKPKSSSKARSGTVKRSRTSGSRSSGTKSVRSSGSSGKRSSSGSSRSGSRSSGSRSSGSRGSSGSKGSSGGSRGSRGR